MTYDEAMVEAVGLADRLGRSVELRTAWPSGYSVGLFTAHDPIRGETIRPGTPLTASQASLRDRPRA